ncbi:MAG: carboxypeptidase regulatory-like domain-containing protein, partial [Deltaproteobacteria bacterium]|nr:carboxypeptidase regulatory-like domain-containing protein [Deltaproteobacteria bacterium]
RAWLDDDTPPPLAPDASADGALEFVVAVTAPGRHTLHVQTGDGCRFVSPVLDKPVVLDVTPPVLRRAVLDDGRPLQDTRVLALFVDAADDLSATLQLRTRLCARDAADQRTCTPAALDDTPWGDLALSVPVIVPADGAFDVDVQVRDEAGLASAVATASVVVDTAPPTVRALVLGDGSGVTTSPTVRARFDVDGATELKLGLLPGLAGVAWQPFLPEVPLALPAGDGEKRVFARFRDEAGNESVEVGATIALDTTGQLAGRVFVEGKDDSAVAVVRLVGATATTLQTTPLPDGSWALPDVPAGLFTVQASVAAADVDADGFLVAQTGVAVEPRQTTTAPDLFVARKRGNVGGTLALEALVAGAGDAGALLELVEAGLTTTTGQDGAFGFSGVLTGTYTLRASKPGYVTQTVYPVVVEHQRTTAVPFADALRLLRGSLTLRALREDGGAAAAVQAVLTGALSVDAFAGDDGVVRFDDLLPGAYALTLRGTGDVAARYRPQSRAPRVVAGETTDLGDVVLPLARGTLTGVAIAEGEAGTGPAAG